MLLLVLNTLAYHRQAPKTGDESEKPVKKTIELAALPTRENTRVNGGEVRPARIQLVVRMISASAEDVELYCH